MFRGLSRHSHRDSQAPRRTPVRDIRKQPLGLGGCGPMRTAYQSDSAVYLSAGELDWKWRLPPPLTANRSPPCGSREL